MPLVADAMSRFVEFLEEAVVKDVSSASSGFVGSGFGGMVPEGGFVGGGEVGVSHRLGGVATVGFRD